MPKLKRILAALYKSIWLYPLILAFILIGLTAFKVNGSSVGVYNQLVNGVSAEDPDLLYGKPKLVRADEWQSGTPLVISQYKNNFQQQNPDIGSGTDVALQIEDPYNSWPAVFRPHTWAFFVTGFENAYAFKWWSPLILLLVTSYFFALSVWPKKRLVAALFSLSIGLSPFLFWWYQTSAFAGLGYAFLMLILINKILDGYKFKRFRQPYISSALLVGSLAFILSCFELLLYPPFQIPIALVVVFYSLGLILKKRFTEGESTAIVAKRVGGLLTAALIAAAIGLAFVHDNKTPIDALTGTLYPGKRLTHSGDLAVMHVFNGYLMPLQQRGATLFRNLSEGSNFILLLPFLLLPGIAFNIWEYVKKRRVDWVFLMVNLGSLIFLARAFIHFGDPLYKLMLLNRVPGNRLMIGIGFIGAIQYLLLLKKTSESTLKPKKMIRIGLVVWLASLAVLAVCSYYVHQHYGGLFDRAVLVGGLAAWFSLLILAVFIKRPVIAIGLLLSFTLISSFRILPLYRGLGFLNNSQLVRSIAEVSPPKTKWVTLDNLAFENIALAAGRGNLSGTVIYPNKALFSQLGPDYEKVYNREGHALFTTENIPGEMVLVKANLFKVKFYCSDFITRNVDYALATNQLKLPCTKLLKIVHYPKLDFYLYQVSP